MSDSTLLGVVRVLLRILSPLAPPELRDRWVREWEGELTHWLRKHKSERRPAGNPGPRAPTLHSRMFWQLTTAGRDAVHLRFLPGPRVSENRELSPRSKDVPMLRSILQDVRFSFRTIRSAPWYSLVTVLTLTLGVGAGVAMFGVLHSVFIRPLPYPESTQLVVGRATFEGELNPWVAGADYYDYRDESDVFQELAAVLPFPVEVTVSEEGEAERISGTVVSPNLLPALRTPPVLGRSFRSEDGLEGAEDVVLLSHGFWQRRLGGDAQVMGKALTMDGDPFTVVGVLPPDFFFLRKADVWIPMRPDRLAAAARDRHSWYLLGRMKDGTTLEQAQAGVDVISSRLQEAYPETNQNKGLLLTGLRQVLTEDYRTTLWILTGAVVLVLLIACGNGAGILLARAPARRFELTIRAAMGAPKGRLVRQLLAESVGLALAGGALGLLLGTWFQAVILRYLGMEGLGYVEPETSPVTLAAALGLSLLTGFLAGAYPAVQGAGVSLTEGLKTGNRGREDGGTTFRNGLVVSQVALSLVLLTASGLLVRSLSNLRTLDPGFNPSGVLTADVRIPNARYPDSPSRTQFFSDLLERVRGVAGVDAAALTSHLPIGDFGNVFRANAQGRPEERERVFLRSVSPTYFESLRIPIISGRVVMDEDRLASPSVAVLSQTGALRLFPDEDPLGRVVELQLFDTVTPLTVIGVVGDVRLSRLEEEPEAALYLPFTQRATTVMRLALVWSSMAERRIATLSLTLLAILPLLLASVGLFAVLAYHVSRRRHEMGVRMALGADVTHVGGLVLSQGLRLVTVGVVVGLGGAVAGTRLLQGMLFDVAALDPSTFIAVTGTVFVIALLACAVPVWRAVRSDPRVALQAE